MPGRGGYVPTSGNWHQLNRKGTDKRIQRNKKR
jgi:hypothetical protein